MPEGPKKPSNSPASDELTLINQLRQGLLVISRDNSISSVLGHSEAIIGRSRESMHQLPLAQLRGVGLPAQDLVERSRKYSSPLNSYDVRCVPPMGEVELVDLHATPLEGSDDILLSIFPRRISAFLEKRNDMEAAARTISGLASMLAHEIKNPLSGIRGAAQLMGRALDDKHQRLTDLVCKEVDRIKGLVDNLENFSAPFDSEIEEVNIHEVLDHVLNMAVAGFAEGSIIRPKFDPSLPPVAANYDRLVQVFLNLVKNAVEAAGPKADITVSTAYRHGIWIRGSNGERIRLPIEILVKDNGPGLPDAIRSHLFEPFVTGKRGGSGLGLSLVARYISDFGGTVTADNHPDGGAVFKVQLAMFEDVKHGKN